MDVILFSCGVLIGTSYMRILAYIIQACGTMLN